MIHPARAIEFDTLYNNLQYAVQEKLVKKNIGTEGLELYCYSEQTVYERQWSETTIIARGLIIDSIKREIVATPFPKFFNVGEMDSSVIPNLPFETFEKMDGSLIIIFHHNGKWKTATKGSLNSDQAKWAQIQIDSSDLSVLVPGTTYLAEAIYPENRIVIHYDKSGLFLLGAYKVDGEELTYRELLSTGVVLQWGICDRYSYSSILDLAETVKNLPGTEEGFVIRFSNGLRLKMKGDEYCRIHKLISRVTPIAIWEALKAGDDMTVLRKELPEEFWLDYDCICGLLEKQITQIIEAVTTEAEKVTALSDKEVGLMLKTFPEDVRSFIFPYRKNGKNLAIGRTRELLFRSIRPTGNVLNGYSPSTSINRIMQNE